MKTVCSESWLSPHVPSSEFILIGDTRRRGSRIVAHRAAQLAMLHGEIALFITGTMHAIALPHYADSYAGVVMQMADCCLGCYRSDSGPDDLDLLRAMLYEDIASVVHTAKAPSCDVTDVRMAHASISLAADQSS